MFEGYKVVISADGRHIIGRKEGGKPAPQPVIEEPFIKLPEQTPVDSRFNGILAHLAESCASDYQEKADFYTKKANALDEEIDMLEEKNQRLRKRIHLWEKLAIPSSITCGILGALLGALVAISNLLANHGPTVTVFGTLGACGLYALFGITIGAFSGALSYATMATWKHDDVELLKSNKASIEEKKAAQAECLAKINEYEGLAKDQLRLSWKLRCKEIM